MKIKGDVGLLANTKHRKCGYRVDRFDRTYIRKLQDVTTVVNSYVLYVACVEGSLSLS